MLPVPPDEGEAGAVIVDGEPLFVLVCECGFNRSMGDWRHADGVGCPICSAPLERFYVHPSPSPEGLREAARALLDAVEKIPAALVARDTWGWHRGYVEPAMARLSRALSHTQEEPSDG